MNTALVTGGAGFIGSHLVELLLAQGVRVIVIDDESTGNVQNLESVLGHPHLEYHRASVADVALLGNVVPQVDEIYHLAAAVGVAFIAKHPLQTIERNIYPTELLLAEACRVHEHGKQMKVFLASTSEVYGKNPKEQWSEDDDLVFGATTHARWSYGCSKAIDEFLALAYWRQYRLPVVIGRFFNVVGPRQTGAYGMVVPRFVEAALAGRPLIVHDDGRQVRCFAHVKDVVQTVVTLMHAPQAVGQVINIGSDQPIEIRQLAELVIRLAESPSVIQYQSYTEAYDADFEDVRRRVPDLSRLRQLVDYHPQYDLPTTVREIIAWKRARSR